MKNTDVLRLFGIIALVVIIGITMAACDDDPEPPHITQYEYIEVSESAGSLTITGMDSFNGQSVYAWVPVTDVRTVACKRAVNVYNPDTNTSSAGSGHVPDQVTGGQVVLKVFEDKGEKSGRDGGFGSYSGSEQLGFSIATVANDNTETEFVGRVTVTFNNGVGSGTFRLP